MYWYTHTYVFAVHVSDVDGCSDTLTNQQPKPDLLSLNCLGRLNFIQLLQFECEYYLKKSSHTYHFIAKHTSQARRRGPATAV